MDIERKHASGGLGVDMQNTGSQRTCQGRVSDDENAGVHGRTESFWLLGDYGCFARRKCK
jgi:hypothetical protein